MLDRPHQIVTLNAPMPHAVEAEQALLGAAMINREVVDRVVDLVAADDFGEQLHARLWSLIVDAAADGGATSPMLIASRLGMARDTDLPGVEMTVSQYLARLVASATTVVNGPDYARTVRSAAESRRAVSIGFSLIERAMGGDRPRNIASDAIAELDGMAAAAATATPRVSIGAAARTAMVAAEEASRTKRQFTGATWGVPSLDRMTHGMHPGNFVVVAGRPGMGKTGFGLAIALKTAAVGFGAYYVSLEMTAAELANRAIACLAYDHASPIAYENIAKGDVEPMLWERLSRAEGRLSGLPIEIEQEPSLTVSQVKARARRVALDFERRGSKLSVIFVDHVGLVGVSDRYKGNKVAETSEVTAELKRFAKSSGVCVVGLVQLSRAVEGRDDKRPQLADLKWSGSIEEDADCVIGLYREAYYLNKKKDLTEDETQRLIEVQNSLEASILKNRHGREGIVDLFCDIGCNVVDESQGGRW